MKKVLKILLLLVAIAVAGVVALVMTFDVNAYRPQIAEALTGRTGRTVKLDGPLSLGLSWRDGFVLEVRQVSIANPPWASRPLMASIGEMQLGVGIQPLLSRKLDIRSFRLSGADIQLETNAAGQSNWVMKSAESSPPPSKEVPAEKAGAGQPIALQIRKVDIGNSRLAFRGKDGNVTVVDVKDMTLDGRGNKAKLSFKGDVSGAPVTFDMEGGALDKMTGEKWPFTADAEYAPYAVHAEGTLNDNMKNVLVDAYSLRAGGTTVEGNLKIALGGARPSIAGTVKSDKLNPDDLKPAEKAAEAAKEPAFRPAAPAKNSGRDLMFSDEPFNLDALKAVDADLDIAIGEMKAGLSSVKDLKARLNLANGRLLVSPFSMIFAGAEARGQKMVDVSSSPAKMSALLNAPQLDMSQLAELYGLESFISGKADLSLDVSSSGNSMRAIMGNANGQISLVAAGGTLSQQVLRELAGSLLEAFAPGTGGLAKPAVNCMVARFKIANGQMQTDGLLIDTAQATLAGSGGINLRDETMDMVLRTKPKTVDDAGLTPPLRIKGPLSDLSYAPDVAGVAQNVAGMLTGGAVTETGVPDIVTQAGQNACVYTLEHPQAGKPVANGAVQNAVKKAGEKAREMGDKVLEGIGNKLFGN